MASAALTVQAAGNSDLKPQNITVVATVAPGASFTASWALANIGTAAANATSTTVVRMNQSATSAAGSNLASINTAALSAGASASQSATLTAPTTPGTYYVWVIADNYSTVTNQSTLSNDIQRSAAFTVQAAGNSDLTPQSITVSAATVAPGAGLTANWTLANIGNAAASATSTTMVRVTQSSTSAVGTNLVSVNTAALSAGASVSQSASLTAPTTPGTYYVWVIADNYSTVSNQSNTANDIQRSGAFTVQAAGTSDLVPQSITVSSSTIAPGANFAANWTLANIGSAAANAASSTVVRITQSSTSSSGTNLAIVNTAALAAGTSVSQSTNLTAPTTPGTYYVWVIADNYNAVTNQSNLANDIQRSAAFTVQAARSGSLVFGFDTSGYQHSTSIDWTSVASSTLQHGGQSYPVSFALLRASKGNANTTTNCAFQDSTFAARADEAAAKGLVVGAYHVAAVKNDAGVLYSPTSEAAFFVSTAGNWIKPGNIRPVLDVEDHSCFALSTYADLAGWVDAWMQEVKRLTGVTPIIYADESFANKLQSLASKYDLWGIPKSCIDSSDCDPATPLTISPWNIALIQYKWASEIPNLRADMDVFQGDWQAFQSKLIFSPSGSTTKAQMIAPVSGSTLPSSTVAFQWSAGSGVSQYWLHVGTTLGGSNLYNIDQGTNLSASVPGLPTNGRTVYVRLWSKIGAAWDYADYTYTAATIVSGTKAQMTAPTSGSTLTSSTVTFQWNAGANVSDYWLSIGTSAGASNLYNFDHGTNLSGVVSTLPTNGSTIYVRLWSQIAGNWQYNDYTYTAVTAITGVKAQMTSPSPSSTLTASTVTFQWNGGTNVSNYWLFVGTGVGGSNLYNVDRGTNLSATVTSLPSDGSTVYVRLWSQIGGSWQYNDYGYTAVTTVTGVKAQMTSPAPSSTLTASTVTFQWNGGANVSNYWLSVGTTAGAANLYSVDRGANLSATVSTLPSDGTTVYVRLWSQIAGNWQYNDYTYTSVTAVTGVKAQMTSPAPASTLAASTVTFQWNGGTNVTDYWLFVGTAAGASNLYNVDRGTNLSATVATLPSDGRMIYVRLWSQIAGNWQYNDYTYTAVSTVTGAKAQMTSPAPASTLTASTVTFQWNGGTNVSNYWLSVGTTTGASNLHNVDRGSNLSATVAGLPSDGSTVYVRLWSQIAGIWQYNDYTYTAVVTAGGAKAQMTSPAPASSLTASAVTFQWNGGTNVTDYWLFVGTTVGASNLYNADRGTNLSATVATLPSDGSIVYVRLWSQIGGNWLYNDYTYTAVASGTSAKAQMTAPAPASTLTASTVTFQWNGGTGVSGYWLFVGTTAGGSNLFNADRGTNLSATVASLPTNGGVVYVRLWSQIAGVWQYNDYTYTAATGQ